MSNRQDTFRVRLFCTNRSIFFNFVWILVLSLYICNTNQTLKAMKRFHKTLKDARLYVEQNPNQGLKIYRIRKKNPETGRLVTSKFWVGTYLEWLNRY